MQQRNFVLFMVLSFLILIGWVWLQNKFWPQKPKTPSDDKVAQNVNWHKFGPTAKAVNVIASRGLSLGGLADQVALGGDLFTAPERRRLAHWDDLSDDQQKMAVLLPPPLPATLGLLAYLIPKKDPDPVAERVPFGSDKTFLRGSFSTRGAGIQNLTLNKFKAANWLGEPVKGELELIPDDPEVGSFLMYHYPALKLKDESPVATLGRQLWQLESNKILDDGTQEVRFGTDIPEDAYKSLRLVKTYRLGPRDYHLILLLEIQNRGDVKAAPFRYQLSGAHGLPIEGVWYTGTYRDAVIGRVSRDGLVRDKEESMRISIKKGGEAVPYAFPVGRSESFLQYAGVMTQFFGSILVVDNKQSADEDMKNVLSWARPTLESVETKGILKDFDSKFVYVAEPGGLERVYTSLPRVDKHIKDPYAGLKKETPVVISYYELEKGRRVATWIRRGTAPKPFFDDITMRVNSELLEVKPGQTIAHQFMLYHGPVKTKLLGQFSGDEAVAPELVDRYTYKLHLRTLTDYRSAGPLGAFSQKIMFTDLLIAVTNLMHNLLYLLHFLVGSYGLTIILLTVVVRGLMFPISRKQAYFSVKMQEITPELKKIKEKYPNDRQAQTQATMDLYRKHNVSPLGSCLPLLMQMPIFLGLYYALQESIHFRLARFIWVDNLAAPDMLKWWTENIPIISDPDGMGGVFYLGPFLNLLPLFAVSLMIVQQKMMTPPPTDEQQEMQQKMMKYMMVFMGIMFYKVASGLCIYFISSSLWGLAERRFLPKKKTAAQLAAVVDAPGKPKQLPGKPGVQPPRGKGPRGKASDKAVVSSNGVVQKLKDWWADLLEQAKKK